MHPVDILSPFRYYNRYKQGELVYRLRGNMINFDPGT